MLFSLFSFWETLQPHALFNGLRVTGDNGDRQKRKITFSSSWSGKKKKKQTKTEKKDHSELLLMIDSFFHSTRM